MIQTWVGIIPGIIIQLQFAHPLLVYKLLQSGACVMQQNKHGTTPFAVACGVGKLSIVRCLLQYGADPTTSNKYTETPACNAIGYALRCNRYEILKYLFSLTDQYPLLAKIEPDGVIS